MITICPRIVADDESLSASTSWVAVALTLGLKTRRVRVDRFARAVLIEDRFAWFWKRTRITDFAQITAITYGFEEATLDAIGPRDPVDRFLVGLRLRSGDELKLFSFLGDGTFTNSGPLPDWWYWDEYLFDYTGTQAHQSRIFAMLLSKLINVTLIPSTLTLE